MSVKILQFSGLLCHGTTKRSTLYQKTPASVPRLSQGSSTVCIFLLLPCTVHLFISFFPTVPVVLRWIIVGVTEMPAAPRKEEEGEDYSRLLVIYIFHTKLFFSNLSFDKYKYYIIILCIHYRSEMFSIVRLI